MYAWKKLWLTVSVAPIALLGCATAPDGARPLIAMGEAVTPGSAGAAHERGKQYFAGGQFGLALQQFQTALVLEPASVLTLNALGATYDRLGRFDLAERSYRQALAVEPQSAQTLNNLGYSYMLQGKFDLAAVFLRDARSADRADARVERNLELAEAKLVEGDAAAAVRMDEIAAMPAPAAPADPNTPDTLTVVAAPPRARIERTTAAVQVLVTGLLPTDREAAPEGPAPIRNASPAPRAKVGEPPAQVATGQLAGFASARKSTDTALLLATPQRTPAASAPRAVEAAAVAPEAQRPSVAPALRFISAPAAAPVEAAMHDAAAPAPAAPAKAVEQAAARTEIAALPPAAAAPAATAATAATESIPALRGPLLEVSNGAGRLRMAARMRDYLAAQGIRSGRLTNAEHFRNAASTIFYRPGWEDAAAALAAKLPAAPRLVMREGQFADLRLELGGDLLDFDRGLIQTARKTSKIAAG